MHFSHVIAEITLDIGAAIVGGAMLVITLGGVAASVIVSVYRTSEHGKMFAHVGKRFESVDSAFKDVDDEQREQDRQIVTNRILSEKMAVALFRRGQHIASEKGFGEFNSPFKLTEKGISTIPQDLVEKIRKGIPVGPATTPHEVGEYIIVNHDEEIYDRFCKPYGFNHFECYPLIIAAVLDKPVVI